MNDEARPTESLLLRLPHAGRGRLRLHKLKAVLSGTDGVAAVSMLGKHVLVKFDGSVMSESAVRAYVNDLSVPAIELFPDPAGFMPAGRFNLDQYPKTSLGISVVTLLLTVYGTLPAAAINMLLILLSWPVYARAYSALVQDKRLSVDFLDALAHITAQLQGNYSAVAFMSVILNVANLIRTKTSAEAKKIMSDMLSFEKREAWVERDGEKVRLPVLQIKVGDQVFVYAGEVIPVDGEVTSGVSSVDQKSLTGESMPALKAEKDKVYAGTAVIDGVLKVLAERVGNKTSVAEIVRIVTEGAESRTEIDDYARKFGDSLVLPALGISAAVAMISGSLSRFTSMIIVDFGTGMRVSAPTAFLAQMIQAARSGILIKGGKSFEKLNKADTVVFDKTGTLTEGRPLVHDHMALDKNFTPDEVLAFAAAAECKFTHPVAAGISHRVKELGIAVPEAHEIKYHIGHGVEARVGGKKVMIGSEKFMADNGVDVTAALPTIAVWSDAGKAALFLAVNGKLAGLISYLDVLRPEARAVVKALRDRGIKKIVMLTGDNAKVARAIAREAGVDAYVASALPEMKVDYIKELQAQGHTVVVVGDGINDSPALVVADVGITVMNGVELAKQAADVILLEENLWKIEEAFQFAANTIGIIKANRNILYLINGGVFTAAAFGALSPTLSSAFSDGASVLATLNSVRPAARRSSLARKMKVKVAPLSWKVPVTEGLAAAVG